MLESGWEPQLQRRPRRQWPVAGHLHSARDGIFLASFIAIVPRGTEQIAIDAVAAVTGKK